MRESVPPFPSLFVAIAVSGLILLGDAITLFDPVRSIIERMAIPLQIGLIDRAQAWGGVVRMFPRLWTLEEDLRALEIEREVLLAENVQLRMQGRERDRFYRQLAAQLPPQYRVIPAYLLSQEKKPRISLGRRDSVSVNSPIVVGNVLLGWVETVSDATSTVMLTTDPMGEVFARVFESNQEGMIIGDFRVSMRLTRVLQGTTLEVGQRVMTSGRDGRFPPGLSIGIIVSVDPRLEEPFQSAEVRPIFQIQDLDQVFVLVEE